jgi:hypothetical protein
LLAERAGEGGEGGGGDDLDVAVGSQPGLADEVVPDAERGELPQQRGRLAGRPARVEPAFLAQPGGPLAGEHASTITVVLARYDDEYEIAAFHNTLVTG